jgi:DNA-directed RNA polymerase subunit RPC12/RpoP
MIIDDEEDFDFDDPTPIVVCPECGSDDLEIIDEDNGEYECLDCGERFTDGEEEDQ